MTSPPFPAPSASPAWRRTPQPTASNSPQTRSTGSTTSPPPPVPVTTRQTWQASTSDLPLWVGWEYVAEQSLPRRPSLRLADLGAARICRPSAHPSEHEGSHDVSQDKAT